MKKISIFILVLILLAGVSLPACSRGQTNSSQKDELLLSGSSAEVLGQILELADLDMGTFDEAVDQDNSESYTGLSYADLLNLAEEAFSSQAEINVYPHLVVVLKAQDKSAAVQLSEQIAENFDSHRWVCVIPDQSFVVTAGQYVLLASTNNDEAGKIKTAFAELAGSGVGEVNEFFQFSA